MNIKKGSKSSILFESNQEEAKIESLFYSGSIVSKLILPDKTIEISKPGDYEYNHINYTGFETTTEQYKGSVNLCKFYLEGIRVAVVFSDSEINKDVLNELVNIDVLVTPYFSATRLKEHIADIDPKTLIILRNFESSQEFDVEDMKKALGVGTIEESNSYKFKNGDFSSDEEYILVTYILK